MKALKAGIKPNKIVFSGVSGGFSRGELVRILNDSDQDLGCGLIAFDSGEAQLILGCHTNEVENILGYASRGALIHRDDMVLQG